MDGLARNRRIAVNIKTSGLMRGASIGINLLLVPAFLLFLGERDYGVWLTISSFLGWSTLLDAGIGNGLKNRLAEALAHGRKEELKRYTSSAYAMLLGIACIAFLLFAILTFSLDWPSILNVHDIPVSTLRAVLLVFFGFFCAKLVLYQVVNIASSKQYTSMADVVNLLINLSMLLAVWLISSLPGHRLLWMSWLFGGVAFLVLIGVSIWAYRGPYRSYLPSLKKVSWAKGKDVMGLGWQFFLIQLAGIIIFSTDNLIISHFIDPVEVTAYHISFRYFGVAIMLFSIITTPIWPAFTEAYQKGDTQWISNITKRLVKVWLGLMACLVIMLFCADTIYGLWVGEEVEIPFLLSLMMCCYVASLTWGTIFVTFVNSTGKLRLQMIFSVAAGLLNIPLSILLIEHTDLGAAGVMLATICCLSYGPFVAIIQYKKLVRRTAKGIWNK